MPVRCGRFESKAENASRPPAEAPTPTTGKILVGADFLAAPVAGDGERRRALRLLDEGFFTAKLPETRKTEPQERNIYVGVGLGIDTSSVEGTVSNGEIGRASCRERV